ncbi:MAG: phage tail terminator-like protein [Alcanivorax jadensis]|uniref:phage tail terminator-like protein n=1 Tax=Alcanivorax jadensis TaxID=64988 RepID=UPI003001AA90
MSPEEIRQTLEGHMAGWLDAPVAYDGNAAPPAVRAAQDAGTPWVRFSIAPSTTVNASITDKPCPRRAGLIFIQVFTERDAGTAPARQITSSLTEHWENETLNSIGPLWTLEASEQRVGPDTNYYQLNLTIPYRAD